MTYLTIDFETRSPLDIRKVGVYNYTMDPRTRVLCFAVSMDGLEYVSFDPDNLPPWLADALADPKVLIHAHNAAMERLVIKHICSPRHGWPRIAGKRFRCSAARAARLALPRALEKAGEALGLDVVKDKDGSRIMRRLSRPIKYTQEGFVYDNDPNKLARLGEYCLQDVRAEEAIDAATFDMPEDEEKLYRLTEKINDRGVRVDVPLIKRLIFRANECAEELNAQMNKLTHGAVGSVTEVAKLKDWIEQESGVLLPTLRKEDLDELQTNSLNFPPHVIEAIKLRQEGAKSSVSKLIAILDRVSEDGRVRGCFVFNGASTGRYTSMGVQLQNLVRDTVKDLESALERLDTFTLTDISRCIRPCFVPESGHVFVDADYNAIEARGVGWLAGASKLVGIYNSGGDPYCEMGTVIYGRTITKSDADERFVGKQTILGCGYGMGPPKFHAQCEKFNQPVSMKTAEKAVKAYRDEFPEIQGLWTDMTIKSILAVKNPGKVYECAEGKIKFLVKDGYLQMKLPSGRRLFYARPKIMRVEKFGREQNVLTYMGVHPTTKQWVREETWGGKLTENAVQAICRDLLFGAMERIENLYDIPIVLSVHDQIVCEVREEDGEWAKEIVKQEMESLPDWAEGFPVFAEPKITARFGK